MNAPSSSLRFAKGHGTENDFVLLFDEDGEIEVTAQLAESLCDRRAGIGADGVIRAVRMGAATGDSIPTGQPADRWFMDYRNSDGSLSEMCGNGARVFAAFLEREAGADLSGGVTIATRGGERTLTSLGDGRYAVGMGAWSFPAGGGTDAHVVTHGVEGQREGMSVDVGNPHTVVALASVEELVSADLSRAPLVTPVPADGTNVEFAVPLGHAEDGSRGHVRMRVHERGSGETRSCGTGACAVALAVRAWAGDGAPDVWDVDVPGGQLTVRISPDQTVLEGPAVLLADGVVDLAQL